MIDALPAYPEYKDTGLPWLGDVPSHWDVQRLKTMLREVDRRSTTGRETLLSMTRLRGLVRYSDTTKKVHSARSLVGYKICRGGEIVMNRMQAWSGMFHVSPEEGLVSPDYAVFRPLGDVSPVFLGHLLRSPRMVAKFHAESKGIGSGFLRLYGDSLGAIHAPLPPYSEQREIERFVVSLDRSVRRFIRNRRRLIKVLNEQKQAIINRAVTRGLDPNVPLKPSGVDWLGNIPKHWEKNRLKFLVRNVNEQTSTRQPDEVYVALEHVEGWTGRITLPSEDIEFGSQVKRFHVGDVLFGKLRPYLAKVTRPSVKGVCVGEFLVLRRKNEALLPEFLEQELRSKLFIDIINSATFGAKMPRADWDFIGNLLIVYPPTHAEQLEILSDTGKQTASLQAAIDKANREVSLIQEYRTRLIADVVTGKVDVRNVKCEGGSVNEEEFEDIEEVEEAVDLLEESEDDK